MSSRIRTGIGGWSFPPWRETFYPKDVRRAGELDFASRHLGVIEINATYHGLQSPASFARWALATPDDFLFTVKGSRFCTNRRVLADGGEAIARFLGQGLIELGSRLGPILWQFMPSKSFDLADFTAFLSLLPDRLGPLRLRHCVEVRHQSFADPEFVALCRARNVAICVCDSPKFPLIADTTADFVYARLMRGSDEIETGYPERGLAEWAERLAAWAAGEAPADLPLVDPAAVPAPAPREVFAFFINAGKSRAPAAAMALARRLTSPG